MLNTVGQMINDSFYIIMLMLPRRAKIFLQGASKRRKNSLEKCNLW